MRMPSRLIALLGTATLIVALAGCSNLTSSPGNLQTQGTTAPSVLVTSTSPATTFPQNKQNEPAVAIDPNNTGTVVAGSNDEIDLGSCDGANCPFTAGVGVSGFYLSQDSGATWTQPTYQGWSDRTGTSGVGDIGTVPNYYEAGLVSDGDPALAFGPQPGADGSFSWANGSRLYYGNLTSNFPTGAAFKGFEAIAVSHTDNVAASGDSGAWSTPVIVSKQNSALFSDKDGLWADNASSSPYFGHVYMCNVAFRSVGYGGAPEPVIFARSTDGGNTWSTKQISSAANTMLGQGRQGCAVRTDSQGTIYVFFESASHKKSTPPVFDSAILMMRSTNGGQTFTGPTAIAPVADCGQYDAVQGDYSFDGVAGARTNSFPSVDIANGAPTGSDATDTIAVTWCDASQGLNNEQALVTLSYDGGATWSSPVNATATAPSATSPDRPDFPSIAISPDGSNLYLTYMAFLQPFQTDTGSARSMQGVVRTAAIGDPSSWTTLHRGDIGDARASSANSLAFEFLGDYTYVAATRTGATAVWTDMGNAADCPAIDAYRQSLVDGSPIAKPAPATACGTDNTFGNTDIVSYSYTAP